MAYHADPRASRSGTLSVVTPSVTPRRMLPENPRRTGATFFNDSASTMYLRLSSGSVSTGSYSVKLADQGLYELRPPIYYGEVWVAWPSVVNTGSLFITEFE